MRQRISSDAIYHLGLGATEWVDMGDRVIPAPTELANPISLDSIGKCASKIIPGMSTIQGALSFSIPGGGSGFDLSAALDSLQTKYADALSTLAEPNKAEFIRNKLSEMGANSNVTAAYYKAAGPSFEGGEAAQCTQALIADGMTYGCCVALAAATKNPTLCTMPGMNPAKIACSQVAKVLARYTWGAVVASVNYVCDQVGGGVCEEISKRWGQLWDSRGSGAIWAAEWALPPVALVRGAAELKKLFGSCDSPNWNALAVTKLTESTLMRNAMANQLWNSWHAMRSSLTPPLPERWPVYGDFMNMAPPEWKARMGSAQWPPKGIQQFCSWDPSSEPKCYNLSKPELVLAANQDPSTATTVNATRHVLATMLDAYASLLGMESLPRKAVTSGDAGLDIVVDANYYQPWFVPGGPWQINTYDWPNCPNDDDMQDFERLLNLVIQQHITIPYQKAYSRVLADIGAALGVEASGLCVGGTNSTPCYSLVRIGSCDDSKGMFWNESANKCESTASTPPLDNQCSGSYKWKAKLPSGAYRCFPDEATATKAMASGSSLVSFERGIGEAKCRPGLTGTFPNCQIPNCPPGTQTTTGPAAQCLPTKPTTSSIAAGISRFRISPKVVSSAAKAMSPAAQLSRSNLRSLRISPTTTQNVAKAIAPPSKIPIILLGGAILAILGYVLYEESK